MKKILERFKEQYEKRVKTCTEMMDTATSQKTLARLETKRSVYRQIITDLETILKSEQK